MVLNGIVPGTYRFVLQGLISAGGNDIVVAESENVVTVNGGAVSLTLDDIVEGMIGELTLKVYAPYTGTYTHADDTLTFSYSDGSVVTLSTADGTLVYGGESEDERGTYWTYEVADEVRAGVSEMTVAISDSEGKESTLSSFVTLYSGLEHTGIVDFANGMEIKLEWEKLDFPGFRTYMHILDVAYGNGKFIAVCKENISKYSSSTDNDYLYFVESTDGISWTKIDEKVSHPYDEYIDFTFQRGYFVLDSSNDDIPVYYSSDGKDWKSLTVSGELIVDLVFGGGKWLGIIEQEDPYNSNLKYTYTTRSDFTGWSAPREIPSTIQDFSNGDWYYKMFVYGNKFLLAFTGIISYSSDGITWNQCAAPSEVGIGSPQDYTYCNGFYFGIVNTGNQTSSGGYYSSDGYSWTEITDTTWKGTDNSNFFGCNKICYGTRYVAVGDDCKILHGSGPNSWSQATISTETAINEDLSSVVYGNGIFVAVGDNGTILRSTDGISWTQIAQGSDSPFLITYSSVDDASYGNGEYMLSSDTLRKSVIYNNGPIIEADTYEPNSVYVNNVFCQDASFLTVVDNVCYKVERKYISNFFFGSYYIRNFYYSVDGNSFTTLYETMNGYNTFELYQLPLKGKKLFATGSSGHLLSYSDYDSGTKRAANLNEIEFFVVDENFNLEIKTVDIDYELTDDYDLVAWTFYDSIYIAIGHNNIAEILIRSRDYGDSWDQINLVSEIPFFSPSMVAYNDNLIMAFDNDQWFICIDGIKWINLASLDKLDVGIVNSFKFSDDRFVVAGTEGVSYCIPPTLD